MCAALMCFSCLDATAKWLNRSFDPLFTVWWRYTASIVLVTLFINPATRPGVLPDQPAWLQVVRSVLLFALDGAQLLRAALPAARRDHVDHVRDAAPGRAPRGPAARRMGRPAPPGRHRGRVPRASSSSRGPASAPCTRRCCCSVAGTFAYAFYAITTRILAGARFVRDHDGLFGLAGMVLMTPVLPFVWSTPRSPATWLLLVALGAFGAIGHWLLILAHARAPAAILSPFIYTQIIWMLALGYLDLRRLAGHRDPRRRRDGDRVGPLSALPGARPQASSRRRVAAKGRGLAPARTSGLNRPTAKGTTMPKTDVLMTAPMMPLVMERAEELFSCTGSGRLPTGTRS